MAADTPPTPRTGGDELRVELAEIRDFLAPIPPFSLLDAAALDGLPARFAIRYLRRGAPFPPADEGPALYVVRKGAVECRDGRGSLVDVLADGDLFEAAEALATAEPGQAIAIEDTLLYVLPAGALQSLRREQPAVDAYFVQDTTARLRRSPPPAPTAAAGDLLTRRVADFATRSPVCTAPGTTIRDAAERMRDDGVSALMIVDDGRLAGIVTDRDLRTRCLAAGLSPETPVDAVMTAPVASVGPEAAAFEALMTMTRRGIHHLPVVDGSGVRGLVSATDLLRWQSASAVHLAGQVRKCGSVGELAAAAAGLPELQRHLVAGGASAAQVGLAIAALNDAITVRLIELAEQAQGPAPVAFAWAACGSQGRHEQTSHSDQDNALILADDYRPEIHGDWFAALARFVNDGLDACGFRYCPGKVMASTPEWRQPARDWADTFAGWIRHTDDMAAMLAANFLDLRVVHGDPALLAPLHATVVRECARHEGFLARMIANTLQNRPPLGFFRHLTLTRGGEHADTFDIKRGGLLPIVDLARIYALAAGRAEIGSVARLHAAAGSAVLSTESARELEDAFAFLGGLRLRHQAAQLCDGRPADNHVAPSSLTPLERTQLKAVFAVVARQQEALAQRYRNRLE